MFFCQAHYVPDWQPRMLLGVVEARSVNVNTTHTHTHKYIVILYASYPSIIDCRALVYGDAKLLRQLLVTHDVLYSF